jgi:anti-sigma regulatory factor (Ser/Thr protein kinase)
VVIVYQVPGPRNGTPDTTAATLRREVPADPEHASMLHHELARWLCGHDAPDQLADDITLATYEAMANCATHAYAGGPDGLMTLTAQADCRGVTVTVSDTGRWRGPDARSPEGVGVRLMHVLTDEIAMNSDDGGTVIRLSWRWPPAVDVPLDGETGPRLSEHRFRVKHQSWATGRGTAG